MDHGTKITVAEDSMGKVNMWVTFLQKRMEGSAGAGPPSTSMRPKLSPLQEFRVHTRKEPGLLGSRNTGL